MATLFPILTLNTFNLSHDRNRLAVWNTDNATPPKSIKSTRSAIDEITKRDFSPVSHRSIPLDPVVLNNENLAPLSCSPFLSLHVGQTTPPTIASETNSKDTSNKQTCDHMRNRLRKDSRSNDTQPYSIASSPKPKHTTVLRRAPRSRFENATPTRVKQIGHTVSPVDSTSLGDAVSGSEGVTDTNTEPFPVLDGEASREELRIDDALAAEGTSHLTPNIVPKPATQGSKLQPEHRQRSSDASSAFVHTMKTASVSNVSFSIIPRSMRLGRSSESHGCFRGYSRYSLDSDRPAVGSAWDESAMARGIKRKQILNELILTEESYVADLKALAYMSATLLASSSTIPNSVQSIFQRNIADLLHVHEVLLEKLHIINFKAAARKWAATKSPNTLETTHRGVQRYTEKLMERLGNTHHSRLRSSMDSADVSRGHVMIGVAEPADVLEIANLLSSMMDKFVVYEEYCANHELIAVEMQKHVPVRRSNYESGIESLNRSLLALDRRKLHSRKGFTIGDLLIKPIQRICRYPLLISDLLKHTPVIDGPVAHQVLEGVLSQLQEVAQIVNLATGNPITRAQVQRKCLLRDRLNLHEGSVTQDQYRALGNLQLCGVLYLTFQNAMSEIEGSYAICMLFDNHILVAVPVSLTDRFEVVAIVCLADLNIESATSGKGLQSITSLHTWKVAFAACNDTHEFLLSACSKTEQNQWVQGLRGKFRPAHFLQLTTLFDQSRTFRDFRNLGDVYRSFTPICQTSPAALILEADDAKDEEKVILRNTHNAQDWQELKFMAPLTDHRSSSPADQGRVTVLAPKRAERTRLEASMGEIYTKDRLPYPGMIGSKGSQIIRASAGSLARKLSFASMQASFSRRSASLSSKKSYQTIHTVPKEQHSFSIRQRNHGDHTLSRHVKPKELPELDTMDSLVGRMIGSATNKKRLSFSGGEKLVRRGTRTSRSQALSTLQSGPEDPAAVLHSADILGEVSGTEDKKIDAISGKAGKDPVAQEGADGMKKKRWSNPISKLKGFGGDGFKNILHSSR